jgi:branched-subunit amino acid permease
MRIGEQKNIIDRVVSKENQIFIDHSPEYVGQAQNILSPAFFLSCLEIAKNFFETRKAYYESETARLDYKASIKKDEKEDEEMFEAYRERRN